MVQGDKIFLSFYFCFTIFQLNLLTERLKRKKKVDLPLHLHIFFFFFPLTVALDYGEWMEDDDIVFSPLL